MDESTINRIALAALPPLNPPEATSALMKVTGELRLDSWIVRRGNERVGGDDEPETQRNHGRDNDPQRMNVDDWPANEVES